MTHFTDVAILGAGQAGLALSRHLNDHGIDHLVLDRGQVGERWQSERWNSLRLLTPNWMTRLPQHSYQGTDPDGFMRATEVQTLLKNYSASFTAPVRQFTNVFKVQTDGEVYQLETSTGRIVAKSVVIATGACDTANVPDIAKNLPSSITQIKPTAYKSPDQIEHGGVLIVGASATGAQVASELQAAGRAVTLAVGSHVRVPRTYRGRDIMHWLDQCGFLTDQRPEGMALQRLLHQPSLQLVGCKSRRDVDLATLAEQGVRLVGRLTGIAGDKVRLDTSLAAEIEQAEDRRARMLSRIDAHIVKQDQDVAPDPAAWIRPRAPLSCPSVLDLKHRGIKTIVWATGYRRDYSWLDIPFLTSRGEINQTDGVTPAKGLFTLGLPNMRRRNSTFIDGVGADAHAISTHIALYLNNRSAIAA